jgi:hypothetical protein
MGLRLWMVWLTLKSLRPRRFLAVGAIYFRKGSGSLPEIRRLPRFFPN